MPHYEQGAVLKERSTKAMSADSHRLLLKAGILPTVGTVEMDVKLRQLHSIRRNSSCLDAIRCVLDLLDVEKVPTSCKKTESVTLQDVSKDDEELYETTAAVFVPFFSGKRCREKMRGEREVQFLILSLV